MRPIPPSVRLRLSRDPQMKFCVICGSTWVEWDHVFTGMGRKQINEWWAIAPLCYNHHRGPGRTKLIQQIAQLWCLERAGSEPEKLYPKENWAQLKKFLASKCPKPNWWQRASIT